MNYSHTLKRLQDSSYIAPVEQMDLYKDDGSKFEPTLAARPANILPTELLSFSTGITNELKKTYILKIYITFMKKENIYTYLLYSIFG